jgi:hypothetical protein
VPPCPRCGLRRADHDQPLDPVLPTQDGPIYQACWTPEEREEFLPPVLRAHIEAAPAPKDEGRSEDTESETP